MASGDLVQEAIDAGPHNGGFQALLGAANDMHEGIALLSEAAETPAATDPFAKPKAYHKHATLGDLSLNKYILLKHHTRAPRENPPVDTYVLYMTVNCYLDEAAADLLAVTSTTNQEEQIAVLRRGLIGVVGMRNVAAFYDSWYILLLRHLLGFQTSYENIFKYKTPAFFGEYDYPSYLAPVSRAQREKKAQPYTLNNAKLVNDPRFALCTAQNVRFNDMELDEGMLGGWPLHHPFTGDVYGDLLADCRTFGPDSGWKDATNGALPKYAFGNGALVHGKHWRCDPHCYADHLTIAMSNPFLFPMRAYAGSGAEQGVANGPYDAVTPFPDPNASPFKMEFINDNPHDDVAKAAGLRRYRIHPQLQARDTSILGWEPQVSNTEPPFNPLPYGVILPGKPYKGSYDGPEAVPGTAEDPFALIHCITKSNKDFTQFDSDCGRVRCACSRCIGDCQLPPNNAPTGQYNVYISSGGRDLPHWVIPAVLAWARVPQASHAFGGCAIAIERGNDEDHLHVQMAVFTDGALSGTSGATHIVNSLKQWLFPEYHPNGCKKTKRTLGDSQIMIKATELTQHSWDSHNKHGALGYLLKDIAKPHYSLFLIGPITAHDISVGQDLQIERGAAAAKKNTKAAISSRNFLNRLLAFSAQNYRKDGVPGIKQVTYDMMMYTPRYVDPTFARKCSTSTEFDPRKMQTIFDLAESSRHPYVTVGEVSYLFYGEDDAHVHNPGGFHTPLRPQRARPATPAAPQQQYPPPSDGGFPRSNRRGKRPRPDPRDADAYSGGEGSRSFDDSEEDNDDMDY